MTLRRSDSDIYEMPCTYAKHETIKSLFADYDIDDFGWGCNTL